MSQDATSGGHPAFIQVDTWTEDGAQHLVMIWQRRGTAHAMLLLYDLKDRTWEAGSVRLLTDAPSHDARSIAGRVALGYAGRKDMADLGMLGGAIKLARKLVSRATGTDASGLSAVGDYHQAAGRMVRPEANRRTVAPRQFGYDASDKESFGSRTEITYVAKAPREYRSTSEQVEAPATTASIPTLIRSYDEADALRKHVEDLLAASLASMGTPECREAFAILGAENWSDDGHRYLARPGRLGMRRRQAARLYPALAPLLRHSSEVNTLVDTARPFEQALLEPLRGMVEPAHADGLTLAALRKLRTLEPCPFTDLVTSVEIAARLPVDWLPRDATDWHEVQQHLGTILPYVNALGVSLRGLVSHVGLDWERLGEDLPGAETFTDPGGVIVTVPTTHPTVQTLRDGLDVARRMADTLVGQVRRSMGISQDEFDDGPSDTRVAGAILYEGRSLPGIHKHQARWHTGLSVLEAALPAHEAGNAWPAAFPPFTAPNGLQVVCMVNEAELKADGREGPDADGIEGLAHCIGGYGKQCYTGESVCASVRSPSEGGFVRVSSVEFEAAHPSRHGLDIVQHTAFENEDPPHEAAMAVDALLKALRDGSHPYDEAAVERRSSDGFLANYAWDAPGAIEQAFEAWRMYLPREIAHGGLDAFRERVAREVGDLPAHVPVELPRTVVYVDLETSGLTDNPYGYPGR